MNCSLIIPLWLDNIPSPAAWVSLDENDNNLNLFLRYLVAALQTRFPDRFGEMLALLVASQPLAVRLLATAFVIPLGFTPKIFLLVKVPEMTKLQVLIAKASPTSLRAAVSWYDTLWAFCTRTHNKHFMTNLLALLASARGKENLPLDHFGLTLLSLEMLVPGVHPVQH